MRPPVVLLTFLVCILAAVNISAATLVVTKTEDTNDGVCDVDCSLREAVAAAAADDTVVFSSLFNTPQTITLSLGQIGITRNVTITGTSRDLMTVSGNNANRIFRITGGVSVSMSGMKLSYGLASETGDAIGGGIYQAGGSLTLTSLIITNNVARQATQPTFGEGGGIFVNSGTLTILSSTISNNTVPSAGRGAGIRASSLPTVNITASVISSNTGGGYYGLGALTVVDSIVSNNSGPALLNLTGSTTVIGSSICNNEGGGGIGGGDSVTDLTVDRSVINDNRYGGIGSSGRATITNSIIRNNANDLFGGRGGAISNTGTMYILNSAIVNNVAFEAGGGIFNRLGHVYVTNSTVSGNYAINGAGNSPCPGGGIANRWNQGEPDAVVVLTNSTVADNRAQGQGGGICNEPGAMLVARNSIIAQNTGTTGADFYGTVSSEGYNLVGNTAGSSGWGASDLQNINPLLAPLGNNGGSEWTHALLPTSPAINAGNNELARDPFNNSMLTYDQRGPGFMRLVGNVDIGAYEANYAAGPVTVGGRVTTSGGRGVAGVRVTFTSGGTTLYAQTNPFGYYRFANLQPGTTYEIAIMHKYYTFDTPQYFTADQNRTDLNFTAR